MELTGYRDRMDRRRARVEFDGTPEFRLPGRSNVPRFCLAGMRRDPPTWWKGTVTASLGDEGGVLAIVAEGPCILADQRIGQNDRRTPIRVSCPSHESGS